ncbi:TAXI family TRAP transporter solute-binding subunit [Roseibium marinum]|uniref:TRAP transporter TAXI family solute receptor n=1 Tax=Roseibium marinum TaxID=281252 RepID=A0A2S3USG4_9HYPH|nr:TAXI family TRAP transporter solute-binding subunit [Roseibium marinum]POF30626.1 TRAP transporter TAXI family solute receptor [Roseibium marinum]
MIRFALLCALICSPLLVSQPASSQNTQWLENVPYNPNTVPVITENGAQYADRLSDARRLPEWFIGIYSGSTISNNYYVAAGICEVMRATFPQHRIHCAPLRSEGSNDNIHLMNSGKAQSILVEAGLDLDLTHDFSPMPRTRYGLSLISHPGVMIVARNSGIDSIADLPGKRVNLGIEGSETRRLWHALLEANNLSPDDLEEVITATADDDLRALCEGEIDVFLSLVGLVSPALIQTGSRCGARVVSFDVEMETNESGIQPGVSELNDNPDIAEVDQEPPVVLDIEVALLFHEEVPNYVTCHIAKALFEHPQLVLLQHLELANPGEEEMFDFGQVLAFHPGVAQYLLKRTCAEVPTKPADFPARLGIIEVLPAN